MKTILSYLAYKFHLLLLKLTGTRYHQFITAGGNDFSKQDIVRFPNSGELIVVRTFTSTRKGQKHLLLIEFFDPLNEAHDLED